MKINALSDKNIDLLMLLDQKKEITSRTQQLYGGLGFYAAKRLLVGMNLVEDSYTNEDREKIIKLTERGKKIVDLIKKIEEVLK
jgi:DNA-binding MarR family transcriptional regulator